MHAAAIQLAEATITQLERLVRRLGSADAPDQGIWLAYRQARLRLGARFSVQELATVLATLQTQAARELEPLLREAALAGQVAGERTLSLAGLRGPGVPVEPLVAAALEALRAELDAHATTLITGYRITDEVSLILGDTERVGALSPAAIGGSAATWFTRLQAATLDATLNAAPATRRIVWHRQAIATLGSRTTDCCLRVHGQIVPMNEPFSLTGTPRFANQMNHPPFHWNCRTVEALVPVEALDDALTRELRTEAARELAARARGSTAQRDARSPTARRS